MSPAGPAPTEAAGKKRQSSGVFWALVAGAVVVLVLGIAVVQRFGGDPALVASPLIGKPAPDVTVRWLEAPGEVQLSDLTGSVTVVNFWASWCTGCRQEHEALALAAAGTEDFDVSFIGINYQDSDARAVAFLDELGRAAGTAYVVDDTSRAALEYGVLGMPETFFIDQEGVIVGKVSGPLTAEVLDSTLSKIILGEAVGQITTGEVENLDS
jgi:cytochrome c biogenesis protein CcmG/thiol:disulfide interchange protein DsbE